jgi:hypothetical protein
VGAEGSAKLTRKHRNKVHHLQNDPVHDGDRGNRNTANGGDSRIKRICTQEQAELVEQIKDPPMGKPKRRQSGRPVDGKSEMAQGTRQKPGILPDEDLRTQCGRNKREPSNGRHIGPGSRHGNGTPTARISTWQYSTRIPAGWALITGAQRASPTVPNTSLEPYGQ